MPGFITLLAADFAFISVWRFQQNTKTQVKRKTDKQRETKTRKRRNEKEQGI